MKKSDSFITISFYFCYKNKYELLTIWISLNEIDEKLFKSKKDVSTPLNTPKDESTPHSEWSLIKCLTHTDQNTP